MMKNNLRDYKLIILLLLSATAIRGHDFPIQVQTLMNLFEERLVNDSTSKNLLNLREVYFNPGPSGIVLHQFV